MAFVLVAAATICLVPVAQTDAVYHDIDGVDVIEVGKDSDFQIIYTNNDYADKENMNMAISYTAKLVDSDGETVSNGVSPSSGSLDNGVSATLTITAPKDAGRCTLEVEYDVEVTYTEAGEDDEDNEVSTDLPTVTDSFRIDVVEPITLSVTLTNTSDIDLSDYGVYFYIDDEMMDDSYQTIDLAKEGEATVTYNWITNSGNGQHTFKVVAADGGNMVKIDGLDTEHTFYIGDSSYTWLVALLVVIIIVLIVVMAWVYRKPVKNYGKPKSRR